MTDLLCFLTSLLFFTFYYFIILNLILYHNLRLPIIFWVFFRRYIFFGIFISPSAVSEKFCGEVFETFDFIRDFITNRVTSSFSSFFFFFFLNCFFLKQFRVHLYQNALFDQNVSGCICYLQMFLLIFLPKYKTK